MNQHMLPQGTVLGGRFELVSYVADGGFGTIYMAKDTVQGRPVSVRVIPAALVDNEDIEAELRERIKKAATIQHRNILANFGMGKHSDGSLYIAFEWVDGQNLRVLLNRRAEVKKRFSFKGAYNIIGHVCNALTHAHPSMCHGAISPRAILVNDAGRVKIGDWGVSTARICSKNYAESNAQETVFWAPEVLKSSIADLTPASDIYSLGALLYELLTGIPPERPLRAPSKLGFSKDVDAVIARCMAGDPSQRFASAKDVKEAVAELVKAHEAEDASADAADDDLTIDVEFDLSSRPAPPPLPRAPSAPSPTAPPRQAALPPTGGPPPPRPQLEEEGRASTIDMGAVLGKLGKSESAHWMVQKGKFDHGPFTDRELVQMISIGEVQGQHQLLDMDTGVRKTVRAWGHFEEYVEEYRIKKQKQEEAAALVKTEKAENRGNAAKIAIALGIIGVVVAGAVVFFLTRSMRQDKDLAPEDVIAALESGEIQLKTGGGLASNKQGKRGGGKRGKGKGGGGGGGGGGDYVPGMSYEDAMNVAVDLGSLTNNAGQKQLTAGDINRIMDRHVRSFLPCMAGQSVKRVDVSIAIDSTGGVIGVSVKQGDNKLQRCVESKVRRIKFPSSASPRTATSWYFEIY